MNRITPTRVELKGEPSPELSENEERRRQVERYLSHQPIFAFDEPELNEQRPETILEYEVPEVGEDEAAEVEPTLNVDAVYRKMDKAVARTMEKMNYEEPVLESFDTPTRRTMHKFIKQVVEERAQLKVEAEAVEMLHAAANAFMVDLFSEAHKVKNLMRSPQLNEKHIQLASRMLLPRGMLPELPRGQSVQQERYDNRVAAARRSRIERHMAKARAWRNRSLFEKKINK
jgi:histone H3/H4